MKRHYYSSNGLSLMESQLEEAGASVQQIHVHSEGSCGVFQHHLNVVESVLKKTNVSGNDMSPVIGVLVVAYILVKALIPSLLVIFTWVPAVFLMVVIVSFFVLDSDSVGVRNLHDECHNVKGTTCPAKHVFSLGVNRGKYGSSIL